MVNKREIGKYGEEVASRYLKQKKYEIIKRNFQCKQGEIDIIAKINDELVFVEVKTRSNFLFGNAIDAVNVKKQEHIYNTARYYLYINNLEHIKVRFDVIEVYFDKNRAVVKHFKQVIFKNRRIYN